MLVADVVTRIASIRHGQPGRPSTYIGVLGVEVELGVQLHPPLDLQGIGVVIGHEMSYAEELRLRLRLRVKSSPGLDLGLGLGLGLGQAQAQAWT